MAQKQNAAPARNRRDGSDQSCTLNLTGPDAKKQGATDHFLNGGRAARHG